MRLAHTSFLTCALASAALITAFNVEAEAGNGLVASAQRVKGIQDVDGGSRCADRIAMNPVVMMTTSGGTLLGSLLSTTTIYSNGLILTSAADSSTGTSSAGQGFVSPQFVDQLRRNLRDLGAHDLCDQQQTVSDVPLTTVTVFSGGQDAHAHSFSYWIPSEDYAGIDTAITGFLLEHAFPAE